MKKSIVTLMLTAGVVTAVQAQYRPEGGEKSLEVNFAPLGGSPISISGIKYRAFSSQTSAFRLAAFVGHSSQTTITQDANDNVDELKDRKNSTTISVQPGIESHFAGTDRLSPYIGGYVNIGYTATSEKKEAQGPDKGKIGHTTEKGGSLNLGLNGVAGFDYYIAKSLYLGSEIGFGFAMTSPFKNKMETVGFNEAGNEVTTDGEGRNGNKSSWQIGPNVVGQLRLGWLF